MSDTPVDARLAAHRGEWQRKPALRAIYADYYARMLAAARPGKSLEIGSGSGHLREHLTDVVMTDILPAPWLDVVTDAQALPFSSQAFDNIFLLDVLHHIPRPPRFFAEVQRVLKTGGRLLMIEPAITPLSNLMFKAFHPEPVDMAQDPLAEVETEFGRDPFAANQAISTRLFCREKARFERTFAGLKVLRVRYLSLLAYPLTGGFRHWSLIPKAMVPPLIQLESLMLPLVGPLIAFRLFIVVERVDDRPVPLAA